MRLRVTGPMAPRYGSNRRLKGTHSTVHTKMYNTDCNEIKANPFL